MIRHAVLFRFLPGVDWSDPRAEAAEAATASHPEEIEEIQGWEFGRNTSPRAVAYDFALIGTFADQDAVERYLSHSHHLQGVKLWQAIATWVVADFVVD